MQPKLDSDYPHRPVAQPEATTRVNEAIIAAQTTRTEAMQAAADDKAEA